MISAVYYAHLCMKCSLDISNFVEEISSFFRSIIFLYFLLCSHKMLSYLYLLFSGTLHSVGCIFPFLLCLSLLFFSQIFVRPLQIPLCHFAFLFLGDEFDHHLQYNVVSLCPSFFRRSIRSHPLNLFVTSTVLLQVPT